MTIPLLQTLLYVYLKVIFDNCIQVFYLADSFWMIGGIVVALIFQLGHKGIPEN